MELTRNNSCQSYLSNNIKRKHCKIPCVKWKENRKEHTEEDIFNLSSDNVYLLFVSFGRFHKIFAFN